MEGELCRLAEQALHALGIVHAGQLDEDTVFALPLDGGLPHAGLVDAAPDDLDRLIDRREPAGLDRLLGEQDLKAPTGVAVDLGLGVEIVDRLGRRVDLSGIDELEDDTVARRLQPGVLDTRAPQRHARIVDQRRDPLAQDIADLHLEQKVGTALKIEAEVNLARGQP